MSQPSQMKTFELPEPAEAVLAPTAEAQAAADAAHASTGWNAYEVWRERVLVPRQNGYNKPRGNS